MPNLLNMPVKYCTDENDNEFSPVVYQESMFNDDGTRMDPVPRKMFAKAYDPTKTYPTENLFCIQNDKYYKFTGSGTTTGTFDPTKWTETDDATELTALNSTLATVNTYSNYSFSWSSHFLGTIIRAGKLRIITVYDGSDAVSGGTIGQLLQQDYPAFAVSSKSWCLVGQDTYGSRTISISTGGVVTLDNTVYRGGFTFVYYVA